MYGDKAKKWIVPCIGSVLVLGMVCVIYMLCVSTKWDNIWGMNGRIFLWILRKCIELI